MELLDLVDQLVDFFRENTLRKSVEISSSSRLKEDLGLDSLDCVELVMRLEDGYAIKIPDEEVAKVRTVEDVAKLVLELRGL